MEVVDGGLLDGVAGGGVAELDEAVADDGVWRGCVVGEDGAAGGGEVGREVHGVAVASVQVEAAVGKYGGVELIDVEGLFLVGQQAVEADVEVVAEVGQVAVGHGTVDGAPVAETVGDGNVGKEHGVACEGDVLAVDGVGYVGCQQAEVERCVNVSDQVYLAEGADDADTARDVAADGVEDVVEVAVQKLGRGVVGSDVQPDVVVGG